MFWRPQKVGSSTVLSILISKGWRYNLLPRRKGSNNGLCIKMAQCFYDNLDNDNNNFNMTTYKEMYASFRSIIRDQSSTKRFTSPYKRPKQLKEFLKDYISLKVPGAGGGRRKQGKKQETDAESMPYRISTNHQLCNLGIYLSIYLSIANITESFLYLSIYVDSWIVKSALNCAFIRPQLIGIYLSIYLSIFISLSNSISIYLSNSISIDSKPPIIPIGISIYLSIYLYIYLTLTNPINYY
jgi:hypothetical protein